MMASCDTASTAQSSNPDVRIKSCARKINLYTNYPSDLCINEEKKGRERERDDERE